MATRFVAVADGDRAYAGYDGGPARGGKGRWRTGEVGEWSSDYPPPLAKRDPGTGLIWTGWLEAVEDVARKDDGTLVSLKSTKVFEEPPTPEQRTPTHFRPIGDTMRPVQHEVGREPTPDAVTRAEKGPKPIKDTLTPRKKGSRMPVASNAPPHAGRPMDQPVGGQ